MIDGARQRRTRSGATATGVIAAIVGLALLAWQISQVRLSDILTDLRQIGAGFVVILAIAFARLVLRAFAWTRFFDRPVALSKALGATLAGDAAGNLTPLSLLVSEPTKALYLRDQIPADIALAGAVAENFFYSMSVAIVIVLGMTAFLVEFAIPDARLRLASSLALAGMILLIAGAIWVAWRAPSFASATLARVPFPAARAAVQRVRDFEIKTYGFVRESHGRLAWVLVSEVLFHVLSLAETYVTLWLLTGTATLLAAFIFDSVGRVINVVFRAIPLRLGVDQTGASLVAVAMGYTSAVGLTLSLVRSGRMITWTLPGLALLVLRAKSTRRKI